MNRIDRDFLERPEVERKWMLGNTWCDRCNKADLGMDSPREYEEHGRIYLEGNCKKCGHGIRSEVTERDSAPK